MRCQSCDYPLWSVRDRICPECGSDFKPTDFDFRPNAVRFACPHCDQSYYGTTHDGHLKPRMFKCVGCGSQLHEDEMVLSPAEGVSEAHTTHMLHPWHNRKRAGFTSAWLKTFWYALFFPHRLTKNLPTKSFSFSPFLFAAGWALLFSMTFSVPVFVLFLFGAFASGGSLSIVVTSLTLVAILVIFTLIAIPIWALSAHFILFITGANTRGGLGLTFQAACFASVANVLIAIPCFGLYASIISWVWPVISMSIMLTMGQQVHAIRATLAALAAPFLAVAISVTLFFISFLPSIQSSQAMLQAHSIAPDALMVSSELSTAAYTGNNNAWPGHASQLLAAQYTVLTPRSFLTTSSNHTLSNIPVAQLTLQDFVASHTSTSQNKLDQATKDAAAALPQNTIAHRLGDYVFTYHDLPTGFLMGNAGDLWTFLVVPDAPKPSSSSYIPTQFIIVGTHDGDIDTFPRSILTQELNDQNTLRAQFSLPPLPPPSTVTHASPAVHP